MEILIALVVLGIIAGGFTRLIVSQTRFYDSQTNLRNARTISRSSMNIMMSDLRMVQDQGGLDFAASNGRSIRVVVPYRFGLVCGSNGSVTTVSMLPTDSATLALASYLGYAWRNPETGEYTVVTGDAQPVLSSTPATCTGSGAGEADIRTVSVAGRTGGVFDLSPAAAGAAPGDPVFFWQRITYSFDPSGAYPGRIGLWRSVEGGRTDELVAPFDADARFRFYTSGSDSPVNNVANVADVRGIDLVLTSESPRTSSWSNAPSKSRMITSVFFKNVRSF